MSQPKHLGHILKIENNPHTLDFLGDAIQARGYSLARAASLESALRNAEQYPPDLILIVDNPNREMDAPAWLARQHNHASSRLAMTPLIILVDAHRAGDLAAQSIAGRVVVLQLPINLRALEKHIQELLWPWGKLDPA